MARNKHISKASIISKSKEKNKSILSGQQTIFSVLSKMDWEEHNKYHLQIRRDRSERLKAFSQKHNVPLSIRNLNPAHQDGKRSDLLLLRSNSGTAWKHQDIVWEIMQQSRHEPHSGYPIPFSPSGDLLTIVGWSLGGPPQYQVLAAPDPWTQTLNCRLRDRTGP